MRYQNFSPRQKATLLWWTKPEYKDKNGLICDGSIRSGKTISMTIGFILWSMASFDAQNFAICGRTIEALRRNVIVHIPRWLEGLFDVIEKRGENKMVVTIGNRVNTYYLFGGKDESSYTLIQGITLAGVLFDEAALMPRSFVEQAMARCSEAGSKFWFNCNPESPGHWLYREWIQQAERRNMLHLHFTMDDNFSLDRKIKARYENMYSGVFYQRYILGLWVAAEGLIYDMFDRGRHVLAQPPETAGDSYVSVDYGTQNPTVFLLWQRERGADRWICRREYYYSGRASHRQKTDSEYAQALEDWLEGIRPRSVIVDPSAASFIAELRQRGYPVLPADNEVLDGIRRVGQLLGWDGLAFDQGCAHTLEEFGAYVWDDKASARTGLDRPVKDNDHCMDALRYFVNTVLGRQVVTPRRRPKGV